MDTDSFFKYTEQFPRRLNQVTFKNWQNMVIVYGGVEVELSGNVLTNEAKFAAMATACSSHAKIVVAEYGRIMPDEITEDNILCVVQPDDKNPTSKKRKNSGVVLDGATLWSRYQEAKKQIYNYIVPKYMQCCDKKGYNLVAPPSGKNLKDVLQETLELVNGNKLDKDVILADEDDTEVASTTVTATKRLKYPLYWLSFIMHGPPAGRNAAKIFLPATQGSADLKDKTAKDDSRKNVRKEQSTAANKVNGTPKSVGAIPLVDMTTPSSNGSTSDIYYEGNIRKRKELTS